MPKHNFETQIKTLYADSLGAQEIANKLNLSINQIYGSLRRQGIRRRTAREQNAIRFAKSPLSFRFKENLTEAEKQLHTAALMLYRGEGAKTGNTVDLANSDPGTLKVFTAFLRRVCQIDENKLKLYLYCFSNQDPQELIKYWSKALRVPVRNFTKPHIRKVSASLTRITKYGVLHVRYSDKRLLEKLLDLSEKIVQELLA